jgi:quinoprotein glucose dehydrogenase
MNLKTPNFRSFWLRALLFGSIGLSILMCAAQVIQERQDLSDEWPVSHANVDWTVDRGNPGGTQFAALAEITALNVNKLQPAWEYHTGDASRGSTIYANPIVIDGTMYVTTASLKAVALDAATGKEKWVFDPAKYNDGKVVHLRNRGVAYWKGAEGERIFDFVRDRVYAINAKSGELIQSFGTDGHIDLREDLGVDPKSVELEMTSPGAIYKNLLILGSRVGETYGASPGHIRAYDVVTGKLKWIFHTIPQKGEVGYDTWKWTNDDVPGGANAWGGITIDEKRGWVFAATGSATEDFYGAYRKGNDLFANCVLAIDASTGKLKWSYQTVHHDIWDYDNPPSPILVTLNSGGTARDAVVQLTKMGRVFVLDRDSGKPIFPVVEVPVPPSDVPGELTSPTQPLPLLPVPLIRQMLTEADLTNISPEAHASALEKFRRYRSGSIFTPPSLQGTITMPGHLGGSEWPGASFDPQLNVLYGTVNEVPTINRLRAVIGKTSAKGSQGQLSPAKLGEQIFQVRCMACHGSNRQGNPPQIPALANLDLSQPQYKETIRSGRGGMPAFSQLSDRELDELAAYVKNPPSDVPIGTPSASRYTLDGYILFNDAQGFPGIAPPWGSLYAINLVTGKILWKVPLGEYPELAAKGIHNTGSMNYGGAVATSGGIVFVAGTPDAKMRAFATHSGQQLWEYQLPTAGYATPSVYMVNGREYVAIAAGGGGKNATKSGDSIIAFALPEGQETRGASSTRDEESRGDGWIKLFDGKTLNGWQQMNGAHNFTVEDGAIVGRTAHISEGINTFLCSEQEFGDFELELETYIDPVINSGIQIRTKVRPIEGTGPAFEKAAGRVNGPQVEIRRYYKGLPTTGMLYGEAIGTNWLSSQEKIEEGHHFFNDDQWNKIRIVARGPRIQTWVNGHLIDDYSNDELYRTHPKGFIGLQIHGLTARELSLPINAGRDVTESEPLMVKFRNIQIRPLQPEK